MKVFKISIWLLIFISFFTSCKRVEENYPFLNSKDEIIDISIVEININDPKLLQSVLYRTDDIENFLTDFDGLTCYKFFGDPRGVTDEAYCVNGNDIVIRFDYRNGEYELVNWCGQAEYTHSRGFNFYSGYNVFDEDAFDEFIKSFLNHVYDTETK